MKERKQADRWFQSAFEHAPIGAAVVGLDGSMLQVNRPLTTMFGRTETELRTTCWRELIHPDELPAAIKQRELLCRGEVDSYELERRFIRRDGRLIWGLTSLSTVYDEDGGRLHYVVHVQDITERKRAEERSRLQSLLLRDIGESVCLVARDGCIRFINRAGEMMYGYAPGELVGSDMMTLLNDDPPGEIARTFAEMAVQLDTYGRFLGEVKNCNKDGTPFVTFARLTPVVVADEEFWIWVQYDITEAKRTTEALHASEERFQRAYEHAPIGMVLVSLGGRFQRVNPALCTMFGYSEQELLGLTFLDLFHPDYREVATREARRLETGEIEVYEVEGRHVHKSGRIIIAQATATLVRDAAGKPLYYLSQLQDITARKEAEEALRESEKRFQDAFRYSPNGMALVDLDGGIVKINRAWCQLFGYAEQELLGRSYVELIHPADVEVAIAKGAHVAFQKIDTLRAERRYRHKSGRTMNCEVSLYLVAGSEGSPPYLVVQLQDITDRKRAEEMLRRAHDELEARVEQRTADLREANRRLEQEMLQRRQAEERMRGLNTRMVGLLDAMTAGFFAIDNAWRLTYVNRSGAAMLQQSPEALVGRHVREVLPDASDVWYEQAQRVIHEQVGLDAEFYFARWNRWIRSYSYPIPDGICTVAEDVTERHTREATAVSGILRELNAHLDVKEAFPTIARGLRNLTKADNVGVAIRENEAEFVVVAAVGAIDRRVDVGAHLRVSDILSVMTGDVLVCSDLTRELDLPFRDVLYQHGFRSFLTLPMRGANEVSGILSLAWQEYGAANEVQLAVLRQVADAVALAVEKSRLFEEVRVGHAQLQVLSRRLLHVQEEERRHLARELHDEIGQYLTGLKFVLDAAGRAPEKVALAQLQEADDLIDGLIERVRDLSLDLRPAMLDDFGLLSALSWLFDRYTAQTAVRVHFEHDGLERRFASEVETAAYRIVQEALTNVARHAGVDAVRVYARTVNHTLSLEVQDSGAGFGLARGTSTSGLAGMRERASLLGGRLTVESAPGRGTRLKAELPLCDRQAPADKA